jgi:hypothetical protein
MAPTASLVAAIAGILAVSEFVVRNAIDLIFSLLGG